MHILFSYRDQYQHDLRRDFYRRSKNHNTSLFTQRYRDHVREITLSLDFILRYHLPLENPLAQKQLKKAIFYLYLAFEDVKGLDFLADLHPSRRSFLKTLAELQFTELSALEESVRNFSFQHIFFPPSRSA